MNNHEKFNEMLTEMLCNQASTTAKFDVLDHFVEVTKMVPLGSGSEREVENDVRIEDGRISFPKEHYGNVKDFFDKRVGSKQWENSNGL